MLPERSIACAGRGIMVAGWPLVCFGTRERGRLAASLDDPPLHRVFAAKLYYQKQHTGTDYGIQSGHGPGNFNVHSRYAISSEPFVGRIYFKK